MTMTDPELDQGLLASGLPMSVYTSLCPPNREHQVIVSLYCLTVPGFSSDLFVSHPKHVSSSLGCWGQNQNKMEDSGGSLAGKPLAAQVKEPGFGPQNSGKLGTVLVTLLLLC